MREDSSKKVSTNHGFVLIFVFVFIFVIVSVFELRMTEMNGRGLCQEGRYLLPSLPISHLYFYLYLYLYLSSYLSLYLYLNERDEWGRVVPRRYVPLAFSANQPLSSNVLVLPPIHTWYNTLPYDVLLCTNNALRQILTIPYQKVSKVL